ncbi:MAG: thaumatin family protein [Halothiobacillus sp.]
MTAQLGQIVTLETSLTGFNQSLDGVPILLSATGGATFVGNSQCKVDSSTDPNHYCIYQIKLPSTAPANNTVTVTAAVVGNPATYQTWNTPTVTITTQPNSVPGTITLQSMGTNTPIGMSSPIWAVLQDSSGGGDTVVTLSASNANISINPGISVTTGAYQTLSCTLNSSNPVCGFGVKGVMAGNATISATSSPSSYTIQPLSFSVNAPLSTSRVIKFANANSQSVWVGITGGTSISYETSALVSTIDPARSGPNKMCGPSNPAGACPTGSTCQQGGATPIASTTYFCYWDQPVPSNGYEIQAGSTTIPPTPATTSISISDSSYDPMADIIWSGNFYPREGCTLSPGTNELICTIANCGNSVSGQACAPGTGGAPAVATLPEVTLQQNSTDYYDISIIGGANVMTTFGPDSSAGPVPAPSGYMCGTAGAGSAQGGLLAADWSMATHIKDPLTVGGSTAYSFSAQTAPTPATAYYRFVSTESPRQNPGCTSSSACTTSGFVCGYDINAIDNGNSSDYTTSCGSHLAWLSANGIWALNANSTNNAPFHFQGSYNDGAGNPIQLNQLFACTAPTVSGYSSPIADPSLACGCTNWGDGALASTTGDAAFSAQIATPSTSCTANNTVAGSSYNWSAYVLPSIAWLKKSCPTCYTYPFDDMSSTFQCSNQASSSSGTNSVPYVITFNGHIPGQ